jgi:hypothetical protein
MMALVISACGGQDTADTTAATTSTIAVGTTTTAAVTTTTVAAVTTTASPSTTIPGSTTTITEPDSNDPASGSGCTPGGGDPPDGEWFGYATDRDPNSVEFDLACWFTGDAAAQAAAEDGEESPPPNDYYIRNFNELTRQIPVGAEVEIVFFPDGDPNNQPSVPFGDWGDMVEQRGYELGVWLIVEDGEVSTITEQWVRDPLREHMGSPPD